MNKEELLQAIKHNNLADYVSTNYWQMTREELKAIAVQVIFTLYDNNLTGDDIDIQELLERLDLE